MKRAAVFFDRDNTLIVSDGYLGDPSKVVLVDGAADVVARAWGLGFATVVFSNQSGVARGMFDEEAVHKVNARLDELLLEQDGRAVVDRHEFCPFHPDATVDAYRQDSELRKPKPGMILRAAMALNLDLGRSWVIGDAPRDVRAGKTAGLRTVLFRHPALSPSPAATEAGDVRADFEVASLKEALDVIERETRMPTPTDPAPQTTNTQLIEPPMPPAAPPSPETPVSVPPVDAPAAPPPAPTTSPSSVPPVALSPPPAPAPSSRLESLAEQILAELRRQREVSHVDFSLSKLMAGITQVVAVAVLFLAYLNRDSTGVVATLLVAVFVQTLTVALLIMGRQK
ncbi:MAG: D-glycero-alpha-D-manno-heptose-1,7-bisphosphate 7-phosphatase [Tepidisphaeraceae bacterium]